MKINTLIWGLSCLLYAGIAHADNVILMIGDGMGANHLKCAAMDKPLYIPTLPTTGWVITKSPIRLLRILLLRQRLILVDKKQTISLLGNFPMVKIASLLPRKPPKKTLLSVFILQTK